MTKPQHCRAGANTFLQINVSIYRYTDVLEALTAAV